MGKQAKRKMRSLLAAAACVLLTAFVVTDGLPVGDITTADDSLLELLEVQAMEFSSPVLPLTVAKSACQAGWLEKKAAQHHDRVHVRNKGHAEVCNQDGW